MTDIKGPAGIADSKTAVEFKLEDLATVAELKDGDRAELAALFQVILDLNGTQSDIVSGQPKTYIDASAFYQYVETVESDDHKHLTAAHALLLEQALNFKALGKGKMGMLGAQLRLALRPYFVKNREAHRTEIKGLGITAEMKADMKEYAEAIKRNNVLAAVVAKNAKSFAAQAGINLYTKMHHWDAKNQKEWTALIAALGISEQLEGEDLRPLVYLALHPIPLLVSSRFRKAAAGEDQEFKYPNKVEGADDEDIKISRLGFVNSVSIRARATPAGCASFAVCAAAWTSLGSEAYGGAIKQYIRNTGQMTYEAYQNLVQDVKVNGECYHPMAREFGRELKLLDTSQCSLYMNIAAAYIFETLKGTLARSAALQKYKDQNSRVISLWQTRFRLEKQADKDSVSAFLKAAEQKKPSPAARLEAIRSDAMVEEAIQEFVKDKAKTIAKAKEAVGEHGDPASLLPPSERGL